MHELKELNHLQLSRFSYIVGLDEVGRGPLAGPVVAAAVILKENTIIPELTDSKKLSEKKRNALVPIIKDVALDWSIARAEVEEIDALNILVASLLAMRRAVLSLKIKPDFALVDGNKCPDLSCPSHAVIKGDSKIASISAASVLAKVERDQEMIAMEEVYPGYGFAKHKGYPTQLHMAALQNLGASIIHRKSYGPVQKIIRENNS